MTDEVCNAALPFTSMTGCITWFVYTIEEREPGGKPAWVRILFNLFSASCLVEDGVPNEVLVTLGSIWRELDLVLRQV